jgi:signal transduction histidine kinase
VHEWAVNRRDLVIGVSLWAVLSLPVCLSLWSSGPLWLQLSGVALLGVAFAVLRRWALVALLIALALTGLNGNFAFALPVISHLVGRRTPHAWPIVWAFTGVFVAGSMFNLLRGIAATTWFSLSLWLVLLGVLPWLAGRYWRQYQELVQAGWQRAEQLEREHRIVAERERLRERTRIARDMHDSLGHELSLIALRAGALEVAPDLDDHHRDAAGRLRATATTATERLQEIIGVLRDGSEPAPLEPAHEGIPALVDRARESGMAIEFDDRLDHQPDRPDHQRNSQGDGTTLSPMVDRAAYRVVQEALTNATKHAPGAAVSVRLTRSAQQTTVTVTNRPPPAGPLPGRTQGSRGLTGLRERARLTGGTLHAGATLDGGFELTARLPHTVPVGPTGLVVDSADRWPADRWSAGSDGQIEERTESADQFAHRRRKLRHELITVVVAPSILIACLSAVMVGYYVYANLNSILKPADFQRLMVGQSRAEVERVLPPRRLPSVPSAYDPPAPTGANCRHYRSDGDLLGRGKVYRLCFAGGRLVAKDALNVDARTGIPGP